MHRCQPTAIPAPPRTRARRFRRARARGGAAALALTVLLVAAPATEAGAVPGTAPVVTAPAPPGLEQFYAQEIVWTPCGVAAECATVRAPLDHADPAAGEIDLALVRVASTGAAARQGSLLVNFGGPGGSGTAGIEGWAAGLDPSVRAAYDVVGFDPRGVGASTAVECVDGPTIDAWRAAPVDPDTPEGLAERIARAEQFAAACAATTGPLLGEVDTDSAARDLDLLRAALGDEQLNYLGYSYGTQLGAAYTELFPERTGRFVLDAAVDPALGIAEMTVQQAAAFERSLRVFAASCLPQDGCPLEGTVDEAVAQIDALLERLETQPLPTADGRPLTADDAFAGIYTPLYEERIWWLLGQALERALDHGDGTALMFLADAAYGRNPDGTYTNADEANAAVNCLDYPVDDSPAAMAALDARLQEVAPTLGDRFSHDEVTCGVWPYEPVSPPAPVDGAGAGPVLVVGGTGDPATPYAWSRALAAQLEGGHLLTREGEGHGSYLRGNLCVDEVVNGYLLQGVLPAQERTC
ncbi:alpha/beta hydrolase [Kocuria turfanensis]|uniref:Proteinase n=1 Tax=Kocuria turfanensis TaxID=388357 RepID=A0A512IEX1_9MICC|nr:alpha/beta hydrolase [Kocuria turfanensis]GEO96246.1 proteinase [Kocuria turfanensis]